MGKPILDKSLSFIKLTGCFWFVILNPIDSKYSSHISSWWSQPSLMSMSKKGSSRPCIKADLHTRVWREHKFIWREDQGNTSTKIIIYVLLNCNNINTIFVYHSVPYSDIVLGLRINLYLLVPRVYFMYLCVC